MAIGRAGSPLSIFDRPSGQWAPAEPLPFSDGWGFTGLFAATLPALAMGQPVPAGIIAGRHVVEVIAACYRPSTMGRPEAVPVPLERAA